jgi:hypothetical protein
LQPTLWAGRLDINMATRKKHTPEQVVRKLATADRTPTPLGAAGEYLLTRR